MGIYTGSKRTAAGGVLIGGDAVFQVPTNGKVSAQLPDNTAGGGNARGTNSVDLGLRRASADQVASGADSFVLGNFNKAADDYSGAIGWYNSISAVSGSNWHVLVGYYNTMAASGDFFYALGNNNAMGSAFNVGGYALGNNNTVAGPSHYVVGNYNVPSGGSGPAVILGTQNTGSGPTNYILGQYRTGVTGMVVIGAGYYSGGDRTVVNTGMWDGCLRTTSATQGRISFSGANNKQGDIECNFLDNSGLMRLTGTVIAASEANPTVCKVWQVDVIVYRDANYAANGTVLLQANYTVVYEDAAATTWALAFDSGYADGGAYSNARNVQLLATGAAATNITWTAHLHAAMNTATNT